MRGQYFSSCLSLLLFCVFNVIKFFQPEDERSKRLKARSSEFHFAMNYEITNPTFSSKVYPTVKWTSHIFYPFRHLDRAHFFLCAVRCGSIQVTVIFPRNLTF